MSKEPRARLRLPRIRDGFAGDILKLVTGSSLAQLTAIIVSPILARLFAPEMFGTAAVFGSLIAIIKPITCLRYELAIVLPERDREAANVFLLSLSIATVVAAITGAAVWLADGLILSLLNAPELAPLLWLVPVLVFFEGFSLALNYWNTRSREYGRLSLNRILKSLTASVSKLSLGLFGLVSASSLVLGNSVGVMLSSLTLAGRTWHSSRDSFLSSADRSEMAAVMKRYRKFPLFSSWTALINTLSWQLPVLMLSASFNATTVGYYSFGNRLVRMPMMLIGGAISQVFFQRAADAQKEGRLSDVVRNVYARLVTVGLFPALLLTLIGRELFILVFGETWEMAGLYTEILSIYMFFNFIAAPLGQLFSVLERQEVALLTNIVLLASRFAALWIGGQTGNDLYTIALFSVSGVVVYGAYSLWIVRAAGVNAQEWLTVLIRTLVVAGVFLIGSWLTILVLGLSGLAAIIVYVIFSIAYYARLLLVDGQLRQAIVRGRFGASRERTE